jgi:hypothetical protein
VFDDLSPPLAALSVKLTLSRIADAQAEWVGRVSAADGEIVALSLTVHDGTVWWHKTLPRGAWADDEPGMRVGLWYSGPGPAGLPGPVNLQLQLPGVLRCDTVHITPDVSLTVQEAWSGFTGQFVWVARLGESTQLGAMFVAREDVTFGRKGIWRLRAAISERLPSPWNAVLGGGRRGSFQESTHVKRAASTAD